MSLRNRQIHALFTEHLLSARNLPLGISLCPQRVYRIDEDQSKQATDFTGGRQLLERGKQACSGGTAPQGSPSE